jgi:signal peptidase I
MPDEFEILGSYADYIAREVLRGGAIRVTDSTMEPTLFENDVVKVEKRAPVEGEVLCVRINRASVFGFYYGDVLQRENGPDVKLSGKEDFMGVVTTVIDRDLQTQR